MYILNKKSHACPPIHENFNKPFKRVIADPPAELNIPKKHVVSEKRKVDGDEQVSLSSYLPCSSQRFIGISYNLSIDLTIFNKCNKIVATALFGGTDVLRPPHTQPDSVCMFAFMDKCSLRHNLLLNKASRRQPNGKCTYIFSWCVIQVYDHPANMRLASRIFKLLLPKIFPNAIYSIWVDGKSQLKQDPIRLIGDILIKHGADIGMVSNPYRTSVYEEHKEIVRLKLANANSTNNQISSYRKAGVPASAGLIDGTVIIRDHRSKAANILSCLWFEEYLRFPPRDQASFGYVAYILGYVPIIEKSPFALNARKGARFFYDSNLMQSRIHVIAWCHYLTFFVKHPHRRRHGFCETRYPLRT